MSHAERALKAEGMASAVQQKGRKSVWELGKQPEQ
jgi:hypothetical protein